MIIINIIGIVVILITRQWAHISHPYHLIVFEKKGIHLFSPWNKNPKDIDFYSVVEIILKYKEEFQSGKYTSSINYDTRIKIITLPIGKPIILDLNDFHHNTKTTAFQTITLVQTFLQQYWQGKLSLKID